LSIAALGIAVVYLLIVVAGAIGALLVLIWLFGETSSVTARTGHETAEGLRGANRFGTGSTPSSPVESERSDEKAA
jgi:hypothetical protein